MMNTVQIRKWDRISKGERVVCSHADLDAFPYHDRQVSIRNPAQVGTLDVAIAYLKRTTFFLCCQQEQPDDHDIEACAHKLIGYDGVEYAVGDRVEISPSTDIWMRGARYGVVVSTSVTTKDRVKVRLDRTGAKIWSGTEDTFRKVP